MPEQQNSANGGQASDAGSHEEPGFLKSAIKKPWVVGTVIGVAALGMGFGLTEAAIGAVAAYGVVHLLLKRRKKDH